MESAGEGDTSSPIKGGVVPRVWVSLSQCPHHLALDMGRVTGIAQKSRENKSPAFWMDNQKGKPQDTGKYQGDYREKGVWENKP